MNIKCCYSIIFNKHYSHSQLGLLGGLFRSNHFLHLHNALFNVRGFVVQNLFQLCSGVPVHYVLDAKHARWGVPCHLLRHFYCTWEKPFGLYYLVH